MTTLNDAIRVATGGGTVNDGLLSFFKAGGASANASFGDAERQWLLGQLGLPVTTPDTNNDLWMRLLAPYPGTINDKMLAYWLSAPSPNQVNELLFSAGEPGFWHDFSDFSTLYQDTTGQLPVTAVEQPFGMVLDKRYDSARGPEQIVDGSFSNGLASWPSASTGTGTATAESGGVRVIGADSTTNRGAVYQAFTTVVGATYELKWGSTVTSGAGGVIVGNVVAGGSVFSQNVTAAGPFSRIYVADATTTHVTLRNGGSGGNVLFDNISNRAIPGIHGTQATAANRPVVSARMNRLIDSGDMNDATPGWAPVSNTSVYDPDTSPVLVDGGSFRRVRVGSTGADFNRTQQVNNWVAGGFYTLTFYYMAGTSNRVRLVARIDAGPLESRVTGVIGALSVTSVAGGPITNLTNVQIAPGIWKTTFVFAPNATGAGSVAFGPDSNVAGQDVVALGAQLVLGPLPATRYQRVTTATDYDSVGFPHYLKFDNVNDGYVTPAFNIGTNCITVFAGVTKLSDAVIGVVAEFSVDSNANNGSFAMLAPSVAASPTYNFRSRGTTQGNLLSAASFPAPHTAVLTGIADISGDVVGLRVNGVAQTPVLSDQGTGPYGNYVMYVGSRGAATFFAAIQLNQLIVRGSATVTPLSTMQAIESYVAGKTLYT